MCVLQLLSYFLSIQTNLYLQAGVFYSNVKILYLESILYKICLLTQVRAFKASSYFSFKVISSTNGSIQLILIFFNLPATENFSRNFYIKTRSLSFKFLI